MREAKTLYDSISDIDERFLLEAQAAPIQRAPARRAAAALAACLCLAAAGALLPARLWRPFSGRPASDTGALPGDTSGAPDAPAADEPFTLAFNDVEAAPAGEVGSVMLAGEDFCPMSVGEALAWFGVRLPDGALLAGEGFAHTGGGCGGGGYGVYRRGDGSVYYDVNTFVFTKGAASVTLTLRTVFPGVIPPPEVVKDGPAALAFCQINGWEPALFRYTDAAGAACVYAEFALGDTVCTFTARGLQEAQLAQALADILPKKQGEAQPRTASGTVTQVDSRTEDYFDGARHHVNECHDYITVDCGGRTLTVWLPGEAQRFDVGERVTLTYRGEPATAWNIWPGQLSGIQAAGTP